MEQVDAPHLASGLEGCGGGMLGQPQRATGDAGVEHREGVVAQPMRALGELGIEQRWGLAAHEQRRAERGGLDTSGSHGQEQGRGEQRPERLTVGHDGVSVAPGASGFQPRSRPAADWRAGMSELRS